MKKTYRKGDKPKHEYIKMVNADDYIHPAYRPPDGIADGLSASFCSRGTAKYRAFLKRKARRKMRHDLDANFDLIGLRIDRSAVDPWEYAD